MEDNPKLKTSNIFISSLISIPIIAIACFFHYSGYWRIFYSFSILTCEIASLVLIFIPLRYIWSKISKKKFKLPGTDSFSWRKWIYILLISCTFINLFCSPCFIETIEYHDLNLEPKGGEYRYYVYAESETGKTYTLESKVNISSYKTEETHYNSTTGEYEDNISTKRCYIIYNIYFSNGGYLYFEEPLEFYDTDDIACSYDQNGKKWKVTLSNNFVENSYFKSPLDEWDYFVWIASSIGTVVLLMIWNIYHKRIDIKNKEIEIKIETLLNKKAEIRSSVQKTEEYKKQNISVYAIENLNSFEEMLFSNIEKLDEEINELKREIID